MSDQSHIPTPAELAYLAGRGSIKLDAERFNDEAADRIVTATRGPEVHGDPNGAIVGHEEYDDGDAALVWNDHGEPEYVAYEDE